MATDVDILVTKYTMDDRDYVRGASRVQAATGAVARDFNRAFKLTGVGSIGGLTAPLRNAAFILAGLATATGVFGFKAMQAAAAFDTMERTFGGALGDMSKGVQMMAAIERYATRSAFTMEALAEAATRLAAAGLSVKTYLPVMERFALVVGGPGSAEGLEMVARALMLAKGGAFGEAMETMRRAGVSAADIRAQGIDVSAAGQIKTTPEEFLRAIVRISEGRVKDIADAITGGAQNVLANVEDVLGQSFRAVGKELNEAFLPLIKKGSEHLTTLVESGVIRAIAEGFTDLLGALDGDDGVVKALDTLAVAALAAPKALAKFGEGLQMFWDFVTFGGLDETPIGEKVMEVIFGHKGGFKKAFKDVFGFTEAEIEKEGLEQAAEVTKGRNERARERRGETGGGFPDQDTLEPILSTLGAIESNTKATERNTRPDVSRRILGGGALGQFGVTPVELAQGPRRLGKRRSGDPFRDIADMLRDAVMDIVVSEQVSAARAGGRY